MLWLHNQKHVVARMHVLGAIGPERKKTKKEGSSAAKKKASKRNRKMHRKKDMKDKEGSKHEDEKELSHGEKELEEGSEEPKSPVPDLKRKGFLAEIYLHPQTYKYKMYMDSFTQNHRHWHQRCL